MKRIVLFDTAQGTTNEGDYIIKECIDQEMDFLFKSQYIVRYSTHQPISRFYQMFRKNLISHVCSTSDYKFLCGTNLFMNSLLRLSPNWNINFTSCKYYEGSIAIGCGMDMNAKYMDPYTKSIYKKILSHDYIHSVRDEHTKLFFESLGVKAINTGCPTLWGFTPKLCEAIATKKKSNVIFTLTDYKRNPKLDQEFIEILRTYYNRLMFWVQGYDDYEYLKTLTDVTGIEIIPQSYKDYEKALHSDDVEYVGTRLHAGIYAMRHGIRSIIICIDNRAEDMRRSYNLPVVNRKNLVPKIISEFTTNICVPHEKIEFWKAQFIK